MYQHPWFSDWDYMSLPNRIYLIFQVLIVAPGLLILGLVMATAWSDLFGLLLSAFSAVWIVAQGLSYRRLQQYRRAGG